jgi:hypothetical protein
VLGAPSGAVTRHDQARRHPSEHVDGRLDDRLERRPAEVQTTNQRVQLGNPGEPHRMPNDVDRARVRAAGQNDQTLAAHVDDQGLVVHDQRIVLPRPAGPSLMGCGHAAFVLSRAVDLAGDQHASVDEQRRLAAFDHLQAFRVEGAPAQRGQLERLRSGDGEAPPGPDERVGDHRQRSPAALARQAGQPAGVIEMPVAEDHRLDGAEVDAETLAVHDHRVRGQPGVEEQRRRGRPAAHRDQRGEAMLGTQADGGGARLELRRGRLTGAETHPRDPPIAGQQRVEDVVHQGRHHDLVDRLERDGINCQPGRGTRSGGCHLMP